MKKDTVYFYYPFGCLIYVININNGIITFSAASYLNDLFTTISQYKCREDLISNKVTELNKDNFETWTVYKKLTSDLHIKADGLGHSFKFVTELKCKHSDYINVKNNLKKWHYENK